MESSPFSSSSSSNSQCSISYGDYINLLLLRPILAIFFVFSFIFLGWLLAWKLVLVHVPLVQEIFGLRKKPVKPKPPTRRLSRIYNSLNARNSTSGWQMSRRKGKRGKKRALNYVQLEIGSQDRCEQTAKD